jgi:Xaa-Pro aminopeptidase
MLGFETLTLAPIDRSLVEPALLEDDELDWLDAYHARVRETLTPLVDAETARWLAEATAPIARTAHPAAVRRVSFAPAPEGNRISPG